MLSGVFFYSFLKTKATPKGNHRYRPTRARTGCWEPPADDPLARGTRAVLPGSSHADTVGIHTKRRRTPPLLFQANWGQNSDFSALSPADYEFALWSRPIPTKLHRRLGHRYFPVMALQGASSHLPDYLLGTTFPFKNWRRKGHNRCT